MKYAHFRRLLGFLRPYRGRVIWSFVLAAGAMGGTVLIPYLTGPGDQRDPRRQSPRADDLGDRDRRRRAWLRLGAERRPARSSPDGCRSASRSTCATLSTGSCSALELSFFDRQQTGQLMSRATVDLQSVRFFLGYGLIFIAQSLLTIVLAAVAMFVLQPALAAISLAPVPFVVLIARRYGQALAARAAGGPAADRGADRGGRGERLGRARGQGVRPGGPPARPLQALGRSACSTSRSTRPGSRPSTRR